MHIDWVFQAYILKCVWGEGCVVYVCMLYMWDMITELMCSLCALRIPNKH